MKDDYLAHYGIKGMKWGVRRFQNADGSLTAAGKKRYGTGESSGRSESKIKTKVDGKKVAKAALLAATVAGAAFVYSKNKPAIDAFIKRNAAKAYIKAAIEIEGFPPKAARKVGTMAKNFGKGVKQGLDNAPERMGRAMAEGAAYIAGMYVVGKLIGGARADDMIKSYNAYNKKNKVGKVTSMDEFIRGGYYDDPDKDDDD